jgi:ATP-binding cassette, subfamily B, bacterial
MVATGSSNWNLIRRMFALARRYRWGCVRLILLQLVLLGLGVAGLGLMGMAIDVIEYHALAKTTPPRWPLGLTPPADWSPLQTTAVLAAALLLVGFGKAILSYGYNVAATRLLQQRIVVQLRSEVYEKLQRLGFRYFSEQTTGSLINRVTGDVQNVRLFVDGVILQMVTLVLSLVFYLSYMLSIHVGLTLVCLASTPLLGWLAVRFSRTVRPAYHRNRDLFDHVLLILAENVRGVQVVKGFARQDEEVAKFRQANRATKDQQQWIFWRVSLFTPAIEMLMSLNLFLLLAYGGYLVIEDRLALGTGLIVFCDLLQQFSAQVTKVTGIFNNVQQSLVGAQRVFEILDAPLEIHSPPRPMRLPRARGAVEFDGVAFAYQPGQAVLEQISFRAEPGQCIAVVGTTGSGKTTLLSLIPRFYDATAGRVLVDGIDVRRLDLDDLRRNIGVVFQENFLFSDTVAGNIAFGAPQASREQIERAARIACAHRFIRDLPQGYDTLLREGGKDLSGGQRQRLALARALLLQPPILLLDDPTSAIDTSTEAEIWEAMEQAMAGRTTFVVAHRLSTLRRAGLILVLKQGRIVEMGSHEELMAGRTLYYAAARLQLEGSGSEIQVSTQG